MTREAIEAALTGAKEEIYDEAGNLVGTIYAPARFKLNRPDLGNGGFLEVRFDEETGLYTADRYDALYDKKHRRYYPGGYCFAGVWQAADLAEAVEQVLDELAASAGG